MKKEQNGRILGLLLASSDSTLLVTKLAGKAVKVTRRLWGVTSAEKGIIRVKQTFFMQRCLLANFSMQIIYQKKPKFNGTYLMVFICPREESKSIGKIWIGFYMNRDNVTIF